MWIHRANLSLMEISYQLDPPLVRWPGIHVSDVIKELNPKKYPEREEGDDDSMMALGRIWEAAVRETVKERCREQGVELRPSVQIKDAETGIVGNLDGLIVQLPNTPPHDDEWPVSVLETKFTTRAKDDIEDNWAWLTQIKSYCHMAGVQVAWLVVLRIPRTGKPRGEASVNILTFTREEIEENWRMIKNGAEAIKGRLATT